MCLASHVAGRGGYYFSKLKGNQENGTMYVLIPKNNTVRRVIFVGSNIRGKFKRDLKIKFRDFKFRDSNQSSLGAWHCCTSDDVIDTRARDLLCC